MKSIFNKSTYSRIKQGVKVVGNKSYNAIKNITKISVEKVKNIQLTTKSKRLITGCLIAVISFNVGIVVEYSIMNQGKLNKPIYAANIDLNYINQYKTIADNKDDNTNLKILAENKNEKEELPSKTIEELVQDVETGKAGDGQARKDYLGDKYDEVMTIINERYKEKKKEKAKAVMATSGSKAEYQQYAFDLFGDYGWNEADLECLIKLWTKESDWNPNSHNNSSGAHGIPQALPASKMASEGDDYMTNYQTQIRWGLKYIKQRYGSPTNAWKHFQEKNWY